MDKYFLEKSKRKNNGKINKIREGIIYSIMINKLVDKNFKTNLTNILLSICPFNYDRYEFKQKGGRNFNYDFLIKFIKDKTFVLKVPIEFKYGVKTIHNTPQFLSLAANKCTNYSYALYFYEKYLPKICDIYMINLMDKKKYLGEIFKCSSTCDFFKELKRKESLYKEKKNEIVNQSISNYLKYIVNNNLFKIDEINKIFEKQYNKIYLLYNGEFYLEELTYDDLYINKFLYIRNNNILVFESETSYINILLRWKNRKGILFPAWQISIKQK